MRRFFKLIAISGIAGFVLLASLYGFVYLTVRRFPAQENLLVDLGMIVAFLLTIPIFLVCGADCNAPWWLLLLTAVLDEISLTLVICALITVLDSVLRSTGSQLRH
jgi:hypothetical protein